MPTAPIRTPAGEDELRHRTRKLGQRHRTMLLLIDGRRSLDELLSLAQRAGAAVSHFDELMQLGLVEVAVETSMPESHARDATQAAVGAVPTEPAAVVPAAEIAEPLLPPVDTDIAPKVEETPEDRLLREVRDLLIDTLRIDSPLFGARTFFRVRSAQSTSELIELVWEIEEHLAHSRHSHDELVSLQRARELLGMGNTRIAGDTQSGVLPE